MTSLFSCLVDDFAKQDDSAKQIVSRAALRLQERGFIIPSIRLREDTNSRVNGGLTYEVWRRRRVWRVELIEQPLDKVLHHGHVDIVEVIETYTLEEGARGDVRGPKHLPTQFVADCAKTEKKLRKINDDDVKETTPKSNKRPPILFANRVKKRRNPFAPRPALTKTRQGR